MLIVRRTCSGTWVDFNGHMRDAYYVLLISYANDAMMDALGLGPHYLSETGCTLYNLDTRVRYLREAKRADPLRVEMMMLDADEKRLHLHSVIRHEETEMPLAVVEAVLCHVDQNPDRGDGPAATPFSPDVAKEIKVRLECAALLPASLRAGGVGLRPEKTEEAP